MRHLWLGLVAAAALETAALACSCIVPGTPEESRTFARDAVRNAVAIVDADVLSEYRPGGDGERVRVRSILWGEAPREFHIARREFASSASCDLLLARGQRKVLLITPASDGQFTIQSLCSDFLLGDGGYLAVTLEEARRRDGGVAPKAGERG
jgi:hypothetical protein